MGRSFETQGKKISEVKGRKLKQNKNVWDKTKSAEAETFRANIKWGKMGWSGLGWDGKG